MSALSAARPPHLLNSVAQSDRSGLLREELAPLLEGEMRGEAAQIDLLRDHEALARIRGK